jgi:hypothetical protein
MVWLPDRWHLDASGTSAVAGNPPPATKLKPAKAGSFLKEPSARVCDS